MAKRGRDSTAPPLLVPSIMAGHDPSGAQSVVEGPLPASRFPPPASGYLPPASSTMSRSGRFPLSALRPPFPVPSFQSSDSPRRDALDGPQDRFPPEPRARTAFVLWPDQTEPEARASLRRSLHRLLRTLPSSPPGRHELLPAPFRERRQG